VWLLAATAKTKRMNAQDAIQHIIPADGVGYQRYPIDLQQLNRRQRVKLLIDANTQANYLYRNRQKPG
jgi:hypothetical protein